MNSKTTFLSEKKILLVLAHPDDEVIFGFPILQDESVHKKILICSSDLNNKERKWCSHRKESFLELCKDLDVEGKCLDYNSEFYRMSTRNEDLSKMISHVSSEIDEFEYDYIFTHNPLGEYGHIDHQIVHQVVMQKDVPVIFTDIFMPSNWVPYKKASSYYENPYGTTKVIHVENDLEFYNKSKYFYTRKKVWTWNKPPVNNCSLYLVG